MPIPSRQPSWMPQDRMLLLHAPGYRVWPSPGHLAASGPNGLKLLKSGSVRGFGRRKARSRVGDAVGSGFHPVFTSKYLAAVATEG